MWDRLVNVPLDQGPPKGGLPKIACPVELNYTGPPLGELADYEYQENFKAILQQKEALETGDVPLLLEVQGDNFAFACAGIKYSKEQFLGAFTDIWLKVNNELLKKLSQSWIDFEYSGPCGRNYIEASISFCNHKGCV